MSIELTGAVPHFLSQLRLESKQEETIRTCVSKYAIPEGFCNKLNWAIYRIVNAIKSLFGVSDWQKAQAAIKEAVATRSNFYETVAQNEREAARNKRILEVADKEAKELLSHCVHAQEEPCFFNMSLQLLDVLRLSDRMRQVH